MVVSNGGTPLTSAAAVVAVIPITVMAPITVGSPQMTNGFFGVTFQATPFATYTIQSADVLNGSWNNRTNVMAPLSGLILIQDAPGSTPQRFYRLKYPPE